MPLKVNKLSNHLFKYADKVILMSATIIDPESFCKSLGIDKFKYVEIREKFKRHVRTNYSLGGIQNEPKQIDDRIISGGSGGCDHFPV